MNFIQWTQLAHTLWRANRRSKNAETLSFNKRYEILHQLCVDFKQEAKMKLNVTGLENIPNDEAVYYVSNHQGTLDPILLIAANPNPMTFISKAENLKLPVISKWGKLIEFVTFDRDSFEENVAMLRQSSRLLKQGKSVLVFPEGTRSKQQDLLPFKAGALHPAYLSKVNIICVTQNYGYQCDGFKNIQNTIEIHFHPPLNHQDYSKRSHEEVISECVNLIQSKLKA